MQKSDKSKSLASYAREYLPAQIFSAFSGSLLLKICAVLLGLASNILIARWLEPEGFGRYSFALAWANLLFVPAMLGTDKLLIREVAITNERRDWPKMKSLLRWARTRIAYSSLVVAAVFAAVVAFMGSSWSPEQRSTTLLAGILIVLLALARLRQSILQGLKKVLFAQLPETIVRPVLLIIFVGILTMSGRENHSSTHIMLANIVAASLAILVGSVMLERLKPFRGTAIAVQKTDPNWSASALPLMMVGVMQAANAQASLLVLGMFSSAIDVGIYSVALRLSSLLSFFLMAINAALAPHYASLYATNDRARLQHLVTRSSRMITILTVLAAIALVVFGPAILKLFGPEYSDAYPLVVIMIVGVSFSNSMGAVGLLLTMTGHERDAVRGLIFALVINVLFLAILVPMYGAVGAAYSTVIYAIIWNTAFAFFVRKRTGIVPSVFGSRENT